jgi:hypothetical protein
MPASDSQDASRRSASEACSVKPNFALASRSMRPPSHPSAGPLPSYTSGPRFVPRPVSFIEMLRRIVGWLSSKRPSLRRGVLERRIVDLLAEVMA